MKTFINRIIFVVSIGFFVLAGTHYGTESCKLYARQEFLNELIDEWNTFEAKYKKDIEEIDELRYKVKELGWVSEGWERIAFEFKADYEKLETKYFQLRDNPPIR